MSEKTIFEQYVEAVKVGNDAFVATIPGESEPDALKRLVIAMNDIPEAVWDALPANVTDWANAAAKAANTMSAIPPCPGFQTQLTAEVTGGEAVSGDVATAPKAKKERTPKAEKAPKVPKEVKPKLNLVHHVLTFCLQNPGATNAQIKEGLAALDIHPSDPTIVIQSTAVKNVRKAMDEVGLQFAPKAPAAVSA